MPPSSAAHPVLARFLSSNAQWSRDVSTVEPHFFTESAKGQAPKVLWLGCSDSRVPESVVLACKPGDVFVHRNIANQFHPDDDSALAVLTYAIDQLHVEHVVVVGHTACGGAAACFHGAQVLKEQQEHTNISHAHAQIRAPRGTPLERWLAPLTELVVSLDAPSVTSTKSSITSKSAAEALPIIVEENVRAQVHNVTLSQPVKSAWEAGRSVHVHGWVYRVEEGVVRDLECSVGP